jgi:thiol-disulfide isomerase/thioredoxin
MKYNYGLLFVIVVIVQTSFADVQTPRSEQAFKDVLAQSKLSVVHFVDYDALPIGKEHAIEAHALTEQIKDLQEDFDEVSYNDDFSNVQFIGVGVQAIPSLRDEYNIKDLSTIILFKDGQPLKRYGEVIKRAGIVSQELLEDWIETYFGDYITKLRVYARNEKPQSRVVNYTYDPYELHYYYRPFDTTTWYRSYWERPYYRTYRGRLYYWRHNGYGHGASTGEGIGIGGHRGGVGYGFGW